MTEFELKQGLSQEIELPKAVQERLTQACAQAAEGARPVQRKRPMKAVRVGLVAAAVGAVLCISAAAVSFANHGPVYQAFFGDENYQSLEYTVWYDENGDFYVGSLNEERVPVDEDQAEALVGAYLSDEGYVWQVGEYTMTIESYLLDENTGTAKISYSLHRDGGIEGLVYDGYTGELVANGSGIGIPQFCVPDNYGQYLSWAASDRVDLTRSTEDTLYITSSLAGGAWADWKAADGFQVQFLDLRRNIGSELNQSLVDTMQLPGLESLPAITIANPETGEMAAVISAIGMKLDCQYLVEGDYVRYVSITFRDGSTYIVDDNANNLQNSDYALYGHYGENVLRFVFNRLVDPAEVASVTIDGQTYTVE